MKRPEFFTIPGLVVAVLIMTALPLRAAEDQAVGPGPAPGLEIFDDVVPPRREPGQEWDSWPAQTVAPDQPQVAPRESEEGLGAASRRNIREGGRDDFLADPVMPPPVSQPPYRAPGLRRSISPSRPPQGAEGADAVAGGGFGNAFDDPFANLDDGAPYGGQPVPPPQPPERRYDRQQFDPGMAAEPYAPPPAPVYSVLDSLNTMNRQYPGLDLAVAHRDLNGAGNIILQTLRQRRVVDAAMTRGIRGSFEPASPYDLQRLDQIIRQTPVQGEDPLLPAQRVNVILDTLKRPVVDDPSFPALMPQLLIRLDGDIYAIRSAMTVYDDDAVFLELARTYARAAATCDYLFFPRRDLAIDIRAVMERGAGMFYPDGSSRGGDVGGITGNLFKIMAMLDNSPYRGDVSANWRLLQNPGRYILDVACPDGTLPLYGPRSTQELTPDELGLMRAFFPASRGSGRVGLAGSNSYPPQSNQSVYGGVYVSREMHAPQSRYLAVRFGPKSDLLDVPTHIDFGSLVMMNRGSKYLVDAGGYGGISATARAHGGLSLNGKNIVEGSLNQPGTPSNAIWRTNASIDYAAGMAGFEDTKTWQRGVLYVKPLPGETRTDYWMVMDHVNMRDAPEPGDATIRFLLAPGVSAYREGQGIVMSGGMNGTGVRVFPVDAGVRFDVTNGVVGGAAGDAQLYDASGASLPASSIVLQRRLSGDSTTSTVFYPFDSPDHRPLRIERDSDIIRGRTGAVVIDHGLERVDVVAWAPPGTELVTPTLNLQLSADLAVFRVRKGKIARIDFVNLERFQAKEPDGGMWSMRLNGPAQSITVEPAYGGGWQVLSDPANQGSATFLDVNFGPTFMHRRFSLRPGELKYLPR